MAARRLISIRRAVAGSERSAYDAAWERLRRAAEGRSLHAWRFSSVGDPTLHVEFLEGAADRNPLADPAITALLEEMEGAGRGEVEEWIGG